MSAQFAVYLVGVCVLGLFYGPVKAYLGGEWLFVVAVVAYLLALRVLGYWAKRQHFNWGRK